MMIKARTQAWLMDNSDAGSWYQAAFGAHYPVLYQHRDEAEARKCLDLLPRLAPLKGPVNDLILDLGCGDGRHMAWLQNEDSEVVGLDLSADLLQVARQRNRDGSLKLVRGDMRALPFSAASFGSVLSLFTAFGYFGDSAANAVPVHEVARVLEPGGHWFLDYFDSEMIVTELGDGTPRKRTREVGSLQVNETRQYLEKSRNVIKRVELLALPGHEAQAELIGVGASGLVYTEEVQVFQLPELDDMAAAAGLLRVAEAGGYDGEKLGSGKRWILVYRKEEAVDRGI